MTEYDTIFFVGGFVTGAYVRLTSTISLNVSFPGCPTELENYPWAGSRMVAATIGGSPVACGGKVQWSKECNRFNTVSRQWESLATMSVIRAGAMVIQINENAFWVMGK